jgi:hypothetical protein
MMAHDRREKSRSRARTNRAMGPLLAIRPTKPPEKADGWAWARRGRRGKDTSLNCAND